jgi:catechol 2,3-dioxygenase-like lactoylglutathione lyase family enzyme
MGGVRPNDGEEVIVRAMRLSCLTILLIISSFVYALEGPKAVTSETDDISATYHPVLYVKDLEKSVHFYVEILGFELLSYTNGQVTANIWTESTPPHSVKLNILGQVVILTRYAKNTEKPRGVRHHFSLTCLSDVDILYQRMIKHDIDIGKMAGISGSPEKAAMFRVFDPDGHYLVFGPPRERN